MLLTMQVLFDPHPSSSRTDCSSQSPRMLAIILAASSQGVVSSLHCLDELGADTPSDDGLLAISASDVVLSAGLAEQACGAAEGTLSATTGAGHSRGSCFGRQHLDGAGLA